ncbi:MAG: hypothetical protein A2W99_01955 [Bacteroidetes bacterium GWF2_33_16]|nr:MAG: hypothetical protein A2X00_16200 [Bacteroidetes bacterium GWE2_32_14]OFY07033.1 MAG: hypothetical protein A2W99_01955 [Bacteroidetes bacterium GWF2_33_16]
MRNLLLLIAIGFMFSCTQTGTQNKYPELIGPYLGQEIPGDSARLFAPGIISTGMSDRDITIYPDGSEIYFCKNIGNFKYSTIFYVKQINNQWTKPEIVEFGTNPKFIYIEPHISPDGKKFYFASNMPVDGCKPGIMNIWICNRKKDNWGEPYPIGAPINTGTDQYYPSVTNDGTLYFTSEDSATNEEFIYRSKFIDGKYQKPEMLPKNINMGRARFNALISPDESFIIVPAFGMPDSFGATDYYIVFRNENDQWSKPINMGAFVNSVNGQEWSASLSPDGNFLFFMSAKIPENVQLPVKLSTITFEEMNNTCQNGNSDIYWIKTDFIKELKKMAEY